MLALPRDNTTFHSTSIKPFNILDVEIEVNPLELECNNQEIKGEEGTIIINTSLVIPLKHSKGHPCKYANVTMFLQDNVQYKDSC
jgi:hypothetical protein